MKTRASLKNRQGGAVAVMVGFSLLLLIGFLAMVIDLGHLYIAKTGLQNAADAAALSGAKELNGTSLGVTSARDRAIEAAGKNAFFGDVLGPGYQPVTLSEANIKFSNAPYTPDSGWLSYSDAVNAPGELYFVKADTDQQNLHTLFAVIWNIFNMNTYGLAVAGRFVTNIVPIGICAIDKTREYHDVSANPPDTAEWGFRRGVSYDFASVNHVFGGLQAGTQLYIHPTAISEQDCKDNPASADFAAPFMCTGQSTIAGQPIVYNNTGLAAGKTIGAINTRFDVYGPPVPELTPEVCPPDSNIKEFKPSLAFSAPSGTPNAGGWMGPLTPTMPDDYQTVGVGNNEADKDKSLAAWLAQTNVPPFVDPEFTFDQIKAKSDKNGGCLESPLISADCSNNYGVLWSYVKPAGSVGSPAVDWPKLYPDSAYTGASSWVPPYSANVTPPTHTAGVNRREVNVLIIDCPGFAPGACGGLPVLGIGKFFLQVKGVVGKELQGEFIEHTTVLPVAQIRLYR